MDKILITLHFGMDKKNESGDLKEFSDHNDLGVPCTRITYMTI